LCTLEIECRRRVRGLLLCPAARGNLITSSAGKSPGKSGGKGGISTGVRCANGQRKSATAKANDNPAKVATQYFSVTTKQSLMRKAKI